jgi:hypothetical protein
VIKLVPLLEKAFRQHERPMGVLLRLHLIADMNPSLNAAQLTRQASLMVELTA